MSRKFMVFIILFLVCGLAPTFLIGCSPTVAKYETTIEVKVINTEKDGCCYNVVISYYLGDTEIIDELDGIDANHYWYIVKNSDNPIQFRIETKGTKGGA